MASVAGRKLAAAGGGDWQEYGCCGWPAGAGPTMGGWPEGGLLEVLCNVVMVARVSPLRARHGLRESSP
ncbi:hypothetical protein GBA52_016679 [Prunus armeniaca]|nr:hypothetical protein GBA52_016679 [Prunus armeniaca]